TAELANELNRCGEDLLVRRRGSKVEQRTNVATHGVQLRAAISSSAAKIKPVGSAVAARQEIASADQDEVGRHGYHRDDEQPDGEDLHGRVLLALVGRPGLGGLLLRDELL